MKPNTVFTFPVGYLDFHKDKVLNFQFNRWYSWGYAREKDLRKASALVHSFTDWADAMETIAKEATQEGRDLNAAFYYRAGEFYLSPGDPKKAEMYENFKSIVHPLIQKDGIELADVPYKGAYLPCMRKQRENAKGTIVIHGGFDSFMEEFYSFMMHLYHAGYEIIVFEGPGQGDARRKHGLAFDYHWELPTTAVLDYFKLQNVTLMGISMGGYLCLRAAAFEPRIKRVIASSIAYDYNEFPPKLLQPVVKLFYNQLQNYTNNATLKVIRKGGFKGWYQSNLLYMQKAKRPIDAIRYLTRMNAAELHCERITQDVLILTGRDDFMVPFKMHQKQVNALKNANSITARVFEKGSQASSHCQIGNLGLKLKVITDWLQTYQ